MERETKNGSRGSRESTTRRSGATGRCENKAQPYQTKYTRDGFASLREASPLCATLKWQLDAAQRNRASRLSRRLARITNGFVATNLAGHGRPHRRILANSAWSRRRRFVSRASQIVVDASPGVDLLELLA